MPRLQNKVAIVAGAGSIAEGWSNGKATSVLFAREGAKVFAVDRDIKAAEDTCAIIKSEGFRGNAASMRRVGRRRDRRDGRGMHREIRPRRRAVQ